MSLFNNLASWYLKKRMLQIETFTKYPQETQLEVFGRLIHTADETAWGKNYGYRDIQSVREFQDRVPISRYERLFPYIERTLKGEKDVLWPGVIKWFSKSSGTTNDKSKFIPVSREALEDCHFKGGKDMLALYLHNRPESQLFTGKGLPIGGSHEINQLNSRSYYGDLSAVLIQNTPNVFNLFRATSKKTALMGEWEGKIQRIAEETRQQRITNLGGVPTWTLVLINKLFELTGTTSRNLLEIWPNLEVFFHGGVSFKPYRKQFEALIPGDQMRYFETYNASEGFFGMQSENDKDDLLLMLDYGIFYEFIRLEDLDQDHPRAYTIAEVETDVTYAMVISTNGGLWRYLIGDTVRFTNLSPFKIKIAGRTKHFINAFGEELMVDNAETALEIACEECGAILENYTAAPIYFEAGSNGAHEWLVEFQQAPESVEAFAEVLDRELKRLNSDYEAKRYKSIALRPPVFRSLPPGTFYKWMKSRGKLGGQNKVPRLANERIYVDAILEMVSVQA
ncbi:MAG: GH3 auxin-responsive promoter family protein [Bacteroidota bacterium]